MIYQNQSCIVDIEISLKVAIQTSYDDSILPIFNLYRHYNWSMFIIAAIKIQMFLK